MPHARLATCLLLALAVPTSAQQPPADPKAKPTEKVYEVPAEGLVIDGKLSKDDPPLANAPGKPPHQVIRVRLKKGQGYVFYLESAEFDAGLILQDSAGRLLAFDNDSGGGTDSRIEKLIPDHGVYRLLVATVDLKVGAFGIRVRPGELTAEEVLADQAIALDREGFQLYQRGQAVAALAKLRQALEIRRKLFPAVKYPDGHPDLANSLNNLAGVLQAMGQAEQALPYVRQGFEMNQKRYPMTKYPDGHPDLATSLDHLGTVLGALGLSGQALPYLRQGLEMRQKLYPESKHPDGHHDLAASLHNLGFVLQALGQSDQALPYYRQALEMNQNLYPASKYPEGHPNLATNLSNLGAVLQSLDQWDQALPYVRQALEMNRKLFPKAKYPDGHPQLARSHLELGMVLETMGQRDQALICYRQSLEMTQRLYRVTKYPDGHLDLAQCLNKLGGLLCAMGQPDQALPYYRRALEMNQKLHPVAKFPDGHPHLATSLNNLGMGLNALGHSEQALPYVRQSLQMMQNLYPVEKYPDGHPQLAATLNSLGHALQLLGQPDQALPYYRQALEMNQKLYPANKYPDGHPQLAINLNNLGLVLKALGQLDQALPYIRQALQMYQKLFPKEKYPDGHLQLATSLDNLGSVLVALGQADQALPYVRSALEMNQKLYHVSQYPDGHPELALNLNNLGLVLMALGQPDQAVPCFRQALEMTPNLFPRDKFPDGHPLLATILNNLGAALQAMGQVNQALPYVRQALVIQQRLLRRELAMASEEAAFDKVNAQPLFRDHYLGITHATKTTPSEALTHIWLSRATVTRLLEQRQANARASGTTVGGKLDEMRDLRRRIDQILQDSQVTPADRDRLLADTMEKRDRLEREVVAAMPTLQRWQELDALGPADLLMVLPPGTVFVDVIRYTHFEYVDKKQQSTRKYVAFIVAQERRPDGDAPGSPLIVRIELGEAAPIDREVQAWRRLIEEYGNDQPAALRLKALVWDKLAPHLPKGTKTLYLTADGDLARMPWAALPIGDDRVLLEEYALAQVPHGIFLLEQLTYPKTYSGEDAVLALGGVRYDSPKWIELPGTATELKSLQERQPITLTGNDATPARLLAELPKARVAHLATHGFFNAEELTKERERAAKAMESRLLGDDTRRVAAKNPLGYVGLVLAKGEVLSGLSIPDVPLTNTRLVTLSACETGLGALTGGEGVQGLQRAFHLAGCPNVVASLWKVSDDATAALMTKFYHELLVNQKPPIEALREAQLLIYRRPDLKEPLLAERGTPRKKAAVATDPQAAAATTKHAATKLWAAFVLSGVGR